jgi:hypothetical protein
LNSLVDIREGEFLVENLSQRKFLCQWRIAANIWGNNNAIYIQTFTANK